MNPAAKAPMGRDLDPDRLAALEEQRDFLLTSLRDLDAEHDAGDLSEDDYATLRDDYTARTAEVIRAIEAHQSALADARPPRSWTRVIVVSTVIVVVAVVAGLLVANASGQRKSGQAVSGTGGAEPPSQQALDCVAQVQTADAKTVLACFQKVLKAYPENATALTYLGWTLRQYGQQANNAELLADAKRFLQRGEAADPRLVDPHVFLAIVAKDEGRFADAKAELATVDRLGGVPPEMSQLVTQLRNEIAAGSSGSTTSTTAPTTTIFSAPTSS